MRLIVHSPKGKFIGTLTIEGGRLLAEAPEFPDFVDAIEYLVNKQRDVVQTVGNQLFLEDVARPSSRSLRVIKRYLQEHYGFKAQLVSTALAPQQLVLFQGLDRAVELVWRFATYQIVESQSSDWATRLLPTASVGEPKDHSDHDDKSKRSGGSGKPNRAGSLLSAA